MTRLADHNSLPRTLTLRYTCLTYQSLSVSVHVGSGSGTKFSECDVRSRPIRTVCRAEPGRPARRQPAHPGQLQVDGPLHLDPGHADGDHRRVDHADLPARHLPGHRHRPARAGQQLLPAVDDPGLPGGHQRAGGHARAGWATSTAGCAPTTSASRSSPSSPLLLSVTWMSGHVGGHLADRHADLPGRGRGHADGQLRRHPDRCLPGRAAAAWPWASTRRRR